MKKKNPSRPPNLKGIKARHIGPSHCLKGIKTDWFFKHFRSRELPVLDRPKA